MARKWEKASVHTALLLGATLLMGGCGFQLRGAPPVAAALQPLSLECDSSVPFELCDTVRQQLDDGGIKLAEPAEAAYRVKLNGFKQSRRASAIQLDASAAEYDLRQSVDVNVISHDRIPVLADAEVRTSEIYSYDDTNVLAKRREEESIRQTLYQRLAQQVIFRLAPLTDERLQVIRNDYEKAQAQPSTESQ
ncbi:hypothetical protein EZI54_07765 [Marinobacter halodurans]|uniref:LPS-assembly lipoprotein LptE n=1 Tax=Marinobacter halodurans TaxID=2528979 RepID=A0ABY1ZLT7_9GAMM|nr:LPS assembly lipoprotein LptE [Marinobacter halodurans]TBW56840.1 hypothetical protein EZI54_07765 [Marinobacter halodurans]